MLQPVRIENEVLRCDVWPKLGGKISSIVDKADGYELLFNFPAEIPTESTYGRVYDSTWYAGWDECFPAVGSGPYVGHPYDQIQIPDHGEVYSLPTTAVPTKDGITTVWHGLRFGYRLARKLSLTGAGLRAEYTLVNLAPFDFRYVWAQHALLAMDTPVRLDLPAGTPMRWSHTPAGDVNRPFVWPQIEPGLDASRPDSLPAGGGWKVFSIDPIRAPVAVLYPERQRRLTLTHRSDAGPAFWGIWLNTGAWNRQRHLAVEPTTGRYDQLDRSINDGSAARVAAGATVQWVVDWEVSAAA